MSALSRAPHKFFLLSSHMLLYSRPPSIVHSICVRQLLLEIRDQVVRLQTLGTFDYQSYAARFAFDSVKRLLEERERLEQETTRYGSYRD